MGWLGNKVQAWKDHQAATKEVYASLRDYDRATVQNDAEGQAVADLRAHAATDKVNEAGKRFAGKYWQDVTLENIDTHEPN